MTSTWWALVALVALGVGLAVAAITRVPCGCPARPAPSERAALGDVPAGVVTRGRALHAALRPSSYGSLLVGLVVPLLLGLTPAGARIVVLGGPAVRRGTGWRRLWWAAWSS